MKKRNLLVVALILLASPLWAGQLQDKLKGVIVSKSAAAPAGPTSPTYFTDNTNDFNSLNYATLSGNNQIIGGVIEDEISDGNASAQYWSNCDYAEIGKITGGGYTFRALVKFDFSQIPSTATISAVEFVVATQTYNFDSTINIYRLTTAWSHGSHTGTCDSTDDTTDAVTWNEYDGTNAWTSPGGDYAATVLGSFTWGGPGWRTVTNTSTCGGGSSDCLVEYVQRTVAGTDANYGIILKSTDETGDVSNKNKLVAGDIGADGSRIYLKVTWSN